MFSINQDAVRIVQEQIIPYAEQLNCTVERTGNGATIVDMGVHAPGGWRAGLLFVEATIGGLGHVDFGTFVADGFTLPSIDVYVDMPQTACLSSQFSGWRMWPSDACDGIVPIGSGPARALARNDPFSQAWTYTDSHDESVFAAQTTKIPDDDFVAEVAEACDISPDGLYVLAARTGSLTGVIQVCSRTVEASTWRIERKGFDIAKIISGTGTSPIPPVVRDELTAMHRVNTALLYGVTVRFVVDSTDAEIERVIDQLPFNASQRFGERFVDIFEEGDRDFYKVDKDIHTVARFEFWNEATGSVFRAGEIREDMLAEAFFDPTG